MLHALRPLQPLVAALLIGLSAQAQFTDDFSDGDFTTNPAWSGDDALFQVNAAKQLQLNQVPAQANTARLSSPNTMADLGGQEWNVWVKQSFSPSSSSYGRVYLVSNQADLTGSLNGYYLQFGETGSTDAVELFYQSGSATSSVSVCRGPDGTIATSFTLRVKVTRDAAGLWSLYVDLTGGTNYVFQASGIQTSTTTSSFIGVVCTYASTYSTSFYYDDFYAGPIIQDTAPPSIVSATVTDDQHVDLLFDEPVEQTSAEAAGNYALSPSNSVATAALDGANPALVHLALASPMVNGTTYTLTVNGVQDLAGNAIANGTMNFTYAVFGIAQPGDVIINELMADPDPVVGLPNAEFVELFNTTTDQFFNLTGWKITDGSSTGTLSSAQIPPGGYLILSTTGSATLFDSFGTSIGVTSFPSLNNSGDPMELWNAAGMTIDAVQYADSWYHDPAKADGGWTLERIDPFTPCSSAANWTASTASIGGTPGAENSVFAILTDTIPPTIAQVFVIDSVTVDVLFSENMDQGTLLSGDYNIEPASGITNVSIIALDRVRITLATELVAGELRTITITDVSDCPGNAIEAGNTLTFALPEPIEAGDVVINEVLYDPRGSGSDFIELYNRSQKVVSLAGLQLANVNDTLLITADSYLLLPGQHVAVATDPANVLDNYPLGHADRMLQMALPTFNNGSGRVVFLAENDDMLDLFDYSDDLQFALLKSVDGVSLERVDPDRPTSDNSNWHSAAEAVNFATPGYQNSQYAPAPAPNGSISIDPAIFSPDNDGYQDVLTITYKFDEPGFVGTMKVFDLAGREVRTLMDNELLGTSGAVSWDGLMEGNDLARIGPYIVYTEAYDLNGNVEKFRKSVVLAHRL